MGYNTKQRDRIMDYLLANRDRHITVDILFDAFREEGKSIGKSTIYRYLDILVNEGTVRKFKIEEGHPACYQYCGDHQHCCEHFHLKCDNCGELFHIDSDYLFKAKDELMNLYGFAVDSSKTVLYGRCAKCSGEDENQ
ncbi:MAG: Fur family transcriptional regulator [Bacillota bacterium]|nr:Fur family transcriptional regulator [Bacillota bacterium]